MGSPEAESAKTRLRSALETLSEKSCPAFKLFSSFTEELRLRGFRVGMGGCSTVPISHTVQQFSTYDKTFKVLLYELGKMRFSASSREICTINSVPLMCSAILNVVVFLSAFSVFSSI